MTGVTEMLSTCESLCVRDTQYCPILLSSPVSIRRERRRKDRENEEEGEKVEEEDREEEENEKNKEEEEKAEDEAEEMEVLEKEEEVVGSEEENSAHQHWLRIYSYNLLGQANKTERKTGEPGTWHWAARLPPLMKGNIQLQKLRALLKP